MSETAVPETPTDAFAVNAELVRQVEDALLDGRAADVNAAIADLHAADLADLLEMLDRTERRQIVELLGPAFDPEVLPELEGAVLEDVLAPMSDGALAAVVTELDSDDAVYLLENLDEERRETVLAAVPAPDRIAVSEALSFPEDSAGRLMQRDFVAVPAYWTVGQVIDHCRVALNLPDDFYEIYLIEAHYRPVGSVTLGHLLRARRPVILRQIAHADLTVIPLDMDQEQVAFLFRQYRLASAPVVDDSGRMVGVITFDDVAEVIEEEAEEDMLRLSGVAVAADVRDPVLRTARNRFTWLLVNLGTAILASLVIGLFDATIAQMVALAVLMPIVASMGGNAGTQTLTVAVRALATRELTPANAVSIFWKETIVGGINGLLFAVLMGLISAVWFANPMLGMVIAVAMVVNLIVAGMFGTLIPVACDRLGVDPAVAAAVFLTTVTDVVGFFAFLGLATLVLL